jgi:hypothetical protein
MTWPTLTMIAASVAIALLGSPVAAGCLLVGYEVGVVINKFMPK